MSAARRATPVASDAGDANTGDIAFGLWVLRSPDQLIDELTQSEFDRTDERMPYFGLLWPAAEALVDVLLTGPRLDGLQVLDLGCGLGACGIAALHRGAQVTFFDWESRALEIVAASVPGNHPMAERCRFLVGDWRHPPELGPFDLILGADVLYERRNGPAVAAFLAHYLRPGAEAGIADPGRPQATDFPALAEAAGLEFLGAAVLPARADGTEITLLRIQRPSIA